MNKKNIGGLDEGEIEAGGGWRVAPWPFTATSSPGVLGKPPWTPTPGWGLVPQWGWGDPGLPHWWQRAGNGNAGSGQEQGGDGRGGDEMGEEDMGSSKGGLVRTAVAVGWGWSHVWSRHRNPSISPQQGPPSPF